MSSTVHFGAPIFSASLTKDGGKLFLSMGAIPHVPRHLESVSILRKAEIMMSPDAALMMICERFPSLAGRFAGDRSEVGEFDVGVLVGIPAPVLRRDGLFIRVVDNEQRELAFRSESVIVLEVIIALADELAAMSPGGDGASRWLEIKKRCELFPFPRDRWGEKDVGAEESVPEARWYAEKLEQSFEYYRSAAIWLSARQQLHGLEHLAVEPSQREWRVDMVLDVPDEAELLSLTDRVCRLTGRSPCEFIDDALASRNVDARQEVVYRRWYG